MNIASNTSILNSRVCIQDLDHTSFQTAACMRRLLPAGVLMLLNHCCSVVILRAGRVAGAGRFADPDPGFWEASLRHLL